MTQKNALILSFILFVTGLLWGGYTLIVYLGVPVHQLVYMSQEQVQQFNVSCGAGATVGTYLCKGAASVWPFFLSVFQMGSPFLGYVVVSLLVFAGILGWRGFKTGHFSADFSMRPIVFVAAFAAALWLIGTTLAIGTTYNMMTPDAARISDFGGAKKLQPFRRFYEPTAALYGSTTGEQALAELRSNYEYLLAKGCLNPYRDPQGNELQTQSGARVYTLSVFCMEASFFARAGIQVILVAYFLFNLLVLGGFFLAKVIRMKSVHPLLFLCLSLGLGALGWTAILWLLAILSLLKPWLIRLLFFGAPLALFPWSIAWLKEGWKKSIHIDLSWKNIHVLLLWLLISYLALNFFNVVRPFPIGWDDLGSYLNRPRLLSSYGAFIPSMSQFQWEYLTSLGFLLFGYDSYVGSTFAMQINWAAGLLSVITIYAAGRMFLGKHGGILSAMLYYFLPMTGHFSFADMKIDNASFFTSALAIMVVLAYAFKSDEHDEEALVTKDWKLLLVAGLILGFSFAIKPTAILSIFLSLSLLVGSYFGALGFSAITVAGFGLLAKYGPLNPSEIASRALLNFTLSPKVFAYSLLVVGLVLIAVALYRKRTLIKPFGIAIGSLVLGIAIACLPWGAYNAHLNGRYSIGGMLTAGDQTAPQVFYQTKAEVEAYDLPSTVPVRYLSDDLKLDINAPACQTSARSEELDRYWGFDKGLSHYLLLPWRQVMNLDAFGYYVTLIPALLLFPLLLLLPYFWSKEARWLRFLTAGTFVFIVQWALVANGIIWYGIGMFLGLCMGLEVLVAKAPDKQNRILFGVLLAASIAVCLVNRFWQFDTQKNIFEYPLGKVTAEALREVTIPDYDDVRQSVVSRHETMTETPYTYRIGTFISYFIPRNREIFPLADHQLNFFNCINQELDHTLTLRRLKALGFNSIIFDTNTQTIEKDPNGSLHQKVQKFVEFVNDPSIGLNVQIYDPGNGIAYILLPDTVPEAVQPKK